MADAIHYLSLSLTNVRAFGGRQTLDLSKDGRPSRWCVIIGENGVGKTTLLQALAAMRPVPAFGKARTADSDIPVSGEAGPPEWAEPALADYENSRILSLVRHGDAIVAALEADLMTEEGEAFSIGFDVVTKDEKLESADPKQAKKTMAGKGPLVIAYSAFRHAGHSNLSAFEDLDPTEALFDESIQLVDPDEVAERIDYNALNALRDKDDEERARWESLQSSMQAAVAALIPGLAPDDVTLQGKGIRVKTPSCVVPIAELSLGAQTMVAWVVDLAWRLHTQFPDSTNPFNESAIVLIDEVELHLHPKWQRILREQLLRHFPRIQFIVSTHAPVTAQESIAAGDPVSIIRWTGDHAEIVPDPFPPAPVRLDEVATGAFDLETSIPKRFEALLAERRDLIRRDNLSSDEKYRLAALNRFAHGVQSGSLNSDAEIEQLMAGVAQGDQA